MPLLNPHNLFGELLDGFDVGLLIYFQVRDGLLQLLHFLLIVLVYLEELQSFRLEITELVLHFCH